MTAQDFNKRMAEYEWDEMEVEMAQHLLETNKTTSAALRQIEEVLLLNSEEAYSLWLHTSHVMRKHNG